MDEFPIVPLVAGAAVLLVGPLRRRTASVALATVGAGAQVIGAAVGGAAGIVRAAVQGGNGAPRDGTGGEQ